MDIRDLNSENYQQFIDKYGTIKDADLAKEYLVINPNSWLVLDAELKNRGDVIAHYIPTGYYKDSVCVDVAYCGMYELAYWDILVPEGFICDKYYYYAFPKIIPNITWPEDFSKEQYLQILSSIPTVKTDTIRGYSYVVEGKTPEVFKNIKMHGIYNINHNENKELGQYPDIITRKCIVFDRSKIKEAVDNFYNNLDKPETKIKK